MAMNNKNTPSGKSLKMSADDLKEMVKAAVAECLGEEKEDTPPAEETAGEGMDVMSVIEEAVEAAAEKRKARKEAGEEVPEEITPDEIIAEAAAILDGLTAEEEAKADDAETEEKSEEEVAEGKATKTTTKCKLLLNLLDIALERGYIDIRRCEDWTKKILDVKNLTASWRKKDAARFSPKG